MKKIWSYFMTFCFVLTLIFCFSSSAFAQVAILVNGVDVDAGGYWLNADTTIATGSESNYNFHYDADSHTLYLNNAEIVNNYNGYGIYGASALTISVAGTNTIFNSTTMGACGINCGQALTINSADDASLVVYGSNCAINASADTVITGGTITANGGITTNDGADLTLSGVDLTAIVSSDVPPNVINISQVGIFSAGVVTITDGADVYALGGGIYANDPSGDLMSAGIVANGGLIVDGNAIVKAQSYGVYGNSSHQLSSYGIYDNSSTAGIVINSGSVVVGAGQSQYSNNTSGDAAGIYAAQNLSVTGGELTAYGYNNAVEVSGTFTAGTGNKTMYYWNSDDGVSTGAATAVNGTAVSCVATHLKISETGGTLYPVYVNNVQFSSMNATSGIACGSGKATLTVPTGDGPYTLILDDATVTTGTDMNALCFERYPSDLNYLDAVYCHGVDLDVNLVGDNVLGSTTDTAITEGIYVDANAAANNTVEGGALTIDGDSTGTLSVYATSWDVGSDTAFTISNCTLTLDTSDEYSGSIYNNSSSYPVTFENANVTVTSNGYYAIDASGTLTIKNSIVNASCSDNDGIVADSDLTINHSEVTATGVGENGIDVGQNAVFTDSKVIATASGAEAIYVESELQINDSSVDAATDPGYDAIRAGSMVTKGITLTAAKANGDAVGESELTNVIFDEVSFTYEYNDVVANALKFSCNHVCTGYSDFNAWSDWSQAYICFAIENGLMVGNDDDPLTFDAYGTVSRAMVVQILYNLVGSPEVTAADIATYNAKFSDVAADAWYYDAVVWGANQQIAAGTGNGLFCPNADVTREEMVTFFWRYEGSPASTYSISAFPDQTKVSDYAKTAFSWAVENGIISGVAHNSGATTLSPQANSTREQIASVITQYARNCVSGTDWRDVGLTL